MYQMQQEGRDTGRTEAIGCAHKERLGRMKEAEKCNGNTKKNWIRDYCLVKDTKLKTEEAGRAPPPSVSVTQRHTSLHHSFQFLLFAS